MASFFQMTLPSMILHTTIFPPAVMKCAFCRYLFLIRSVPPHTPLPWRRKKLSQAARADPSFCWQPVCCCWWGMSNGSTAVLITSAHTCTPPRATHLIAPHPPAPQRAFLQVLISAYALHSWIEAVCPLVPRLCGIYSFARINLTRWRGSAAVWVNCPFVLSAFCFPRWGKVAVFTVCADCALRTRLVTFVYDF